MVFSQKGYSRRDFITSVGALLLAIPLAARATRGQAWDEQSLKRLVWAGWCAGVAGTSTLIDYSLSLCGNEQLSIPEVFAGFPTKRGRPDTVEQAKVVHAIARLREPAGAIQFPYSHEWDRISLERFVRAELIRRTADIDCAQLPRKTLPDEVSQWLTKPNASIQTLVQQIGENSVPQFLQGFLRVQELNKLAGPMLPHAALAIDLALGRKLVEVDTEQFKNFLGSTDGLIAGLKHLIPEEVASLSKSFNALSSASFSPVAGALPVVSCTLLTGAVAGLVSGFVTRGELSAVRRELAEMNRRLNKIEEMVGTLGEELSKVRALVEKIDRNVQVAIKDIQQVHHQIDLFRGDVARAELHDSLNRIEHSEHSTRLLPYDETDARTQISEAVQLAGNTHSTGTKDLVNRRIHTLIDTADGDQISRLTDDRPLDRSLFLADFSIDILDKLARTETFRLPTGQEVGTALPHPEYWYHAARIAGLARTQIELLSERDADRLKKLTSVGEKLVATLRNAARVEVISPLAEKIRIWWTKGPGMSHLSQALQAAQRASPLQPPVKLGYTSIADLPYESFWIPRRSMCKLFIGNRISPNKDELWQLQGADPVEIALNLGICKADWTFIDKEGKSISGRSNFRHVAYRDAGVVPGSPAATYPVSELRRIPGGLAPGIAYGRRMITAQDGNVIAQNDESYLGLVAGGPPRTICAYSTIEGKTAYDCLNDVYKSVERVQQNVRKGLCERLKTVFQDDDIQNEFRQRHWTVAGAVTLAAWHLADDGQVTFPRLFDGAHQVPATVEAITHIMGSITDGDPFISVEKAIFAFDRLLQQRIEAVLAFVKNTEHITSIPMFARALHGLRISS